MTRSADREISLSNAEQGSIAEGTQPGSQGVDVQVTFRQVVTPEDLAYSKGHVYRKEITLLASPKV